MFAGASKEELFNIHMFPIASHLTGVSKRELLSFLLSDRGEAIKLTKENEAMREAIWDPIRRHYRKGGVFHEISREVRYFFFKRRGPS